MNHKNYLINYTLHLADNALILGHRNSEWTAHAPALEQDIAITNIALDLIGQARNFYQYAAELINQENKLSSSKALSLCGERVGDEASEDTLAYLRDVPEFKNILLVEQTNVDWAKTILRQFFFSAYQYFFYQKLQTSNDQMLAAIAEKSLKEVTYHLRWSSEWVIRLGDGTEESHARMNKAIDDLWMFTGEMFKLAEYEKELLAENISVDISLIKNDWIQKVKDVFEEGKLPSPFGDGAGMRQMQNGGKIGIHSEHLGYILAEMQFLQRAYPDSVW